ncbi:transketolase, partial [Pseudomonas syringae pv. tagetis]
MAQRAHNIRRHPMRMGQVQGQGYVGQALAAADLLADSYFHAKRNRPEDPEREQRHRYYQTIG